MTHVVAWTAVLWLALSAEHGRPDLLPSGCLTVPMAVACVFWFRSGTGVLLAGFAMLWSWLLRPTSPPLDVLLIAATGFLPAVRWTNGFVPSGHNGRPSEWRWLVLLTAVLCFVHAAAVNTGAPADEQFVSAAVTRHFARQMCIALPSALLLSLVLRAADEFGHRHSRQRLRTNGT